MIVDTKLHTKLFRRNVRSLLFSSLVSRRIISGLSVPGNLIAEYFRYGKFTIVELQLEDGDLVRRYHGLASKSPKDKGNLGGVSLAYRRAFQKMYLDTRKRLTLDSRTEAPTSGSEDITEAPGSMRNYVCVERFR